MRKKYIFLVLGMCMICFCVGCNNNLKKESVKIADWMFDKNTQIDICINEYGNEYEVKESRGATYYSWNGIELIEGYKGELQATAIFDDKCADSFQWEFYGTENELKRIMNAPRLQN